MSSQEFPFRQSEESHSHPGDREQFTLAAHDRTDHGLHAGEIDHGELGGLGDADHGAYVEVAGDTMTGDLTIDKAGAALNVGLSDSGVGPYSINFGNNTASDFFSIHFRTSPQTLSFEDSAGKELAKWPLDGSGDDVAMWLHRRAGAPSLKSTTSYLIMDSNGDQVRLNNYVADDVSLANGGGNVGIGRNTMASKLDVNGDVRSRGHFLASDVDGVWHEFGPEGEGGHDGMWVRTTNNRNTIFGVQSSGFATRFRVDHNHPGTILDSNGMHILTNGDFVIDSITGGTRLSAHTDLITIEMIRDGTSDQLHLDANDILTLGGSGAQGHEPAVFSVSIANDTTSSGGNLFIGAGGGMSRSTSSLRYKPDWEFEPNLADVQLPDPITWSATEEDNRLPTGERMVGLGAEHVDEVFPEAVYHNRETGEPESIHIGTIQAVLVAKVKRLEEAVL